MFVVFTKIADWAVFSLLGLDNSTKLGDALHFFVEDILKIFALLVVMIYSVALLRASLNTERVRDYLAGKNRFIAYFLGSVFGAVTPFCSCSSIPVFLGFTKAGIPIGITMSFLLTSPVINEVAVVLLLSLVGWKITVIYCLVGMAVGIWGGAFLDMIGADTMLQPFARQAQQGSQGKSLKTGLGPRLTMRQRHDFAKDELADIFKRVYKWVFIGVGLGAALHGYVPQEWVVSRLGEGQWWSVPAAVLLGIPLYTNATGVIPIMESLIIKGLPLGTTLALCMSAVAASFPEFVLLKQVMQWRLLTILFFLLLFSFTIVGWILNLSIPLLNW